MTPKFPLAHMDTEVLCDQHVEPMKVEKLSRRPHQFTLTRSIRDDGAFRSPRPRQSVPSGGSVAADLEVRGLSVWWHTSLVANFREVILQE
jgi:hypothetical protein